MKTKGTGFNLLIVDDERFILDSLSGFLEDYDFSVFQADSAESALEILEETGIDAAVVDLRLPVMSGETLIHTIHQRFPDIRFLIHTGSVGYKLTKDLKTIGLRDDHVFFKPVPDLSKLVEKLFSLLEENYGDT